MNAFRVVSTIWHTKDNKYYNPGEVVDLSHLDGMSLAAVLKSGAVVPYVETSEEKKTAKAEEKAAKAAEKEEK